MCSGTKVKSGKVTWCYKYVTCKQVLKLTSPSKFGEVSFDFGFPLFKD